MTGSLKITIGAIAYVKRTLAAWEPKDTWLRGVLSYTHELLTDYEDELKNSQEQKPFSREVALRGAKDWIHYSESGMGLGLNDLIRNRLLPPSQAKRRSGYPGPTKGVNWNEFEAMALHQACSLLERLFFDAKIYNKQILES